MTKDTPMTNDSRDFIKSLTEHGYESIVENPTAGQSVTAEVWARAQREEAGEYNERSQEDLMYQQEDFRYGTISELDNLTLDDSL